MGSANDDQGGAPQDEQHHEPHDEHREPNSSSRNESSPGGERAAGNGASAAGPVVITTTDPSIYSEYAYLTDPVSDPDQAMVIEASTSRIRESHGAVIPRVYTGVVEHVRPPHERQDSGKRSRDEQAGKGGDGKGRKGSDGADRHSGKDGHSKKDEPRSGQDRKKEQGESGGRGKEPRGRQAQGPSLPKVLLFSGLVSLVCGVIGGAGYSYFSGSSRSDDQKGSGSGSGSGSSKDSGSSKKSGSSDSGSDKGSDKGSDAGSAKDSETQSQSDTSSKADNGMDRSAPGPAGGSIRFRYADRGARTPHPPFGHLLPGGEKGTVTALAEREGHRGGLLSGPPGESRLLTIGI